MKFIEKESPHYPKVLIVDDDKFSRTLLRIVLRAQEYEIVGDAYTGLEALDRVHQLKPDIVLMDVLMPEMSGIQALRRLKQTNPEIIVVMITSTTCIDAEIIDAGACGIVKKPYSPIELLDVVKTCWEKRN